MNRAVTLLTFALAACSTPQSVQMASSRPIAQAVSEPSVTEGRNEEPLPPLAKLGIAMELRSWGRLIASFSIDHTGMTEFREMKEVDGMYNYDVVIKRFHVGPQGFAKLKEMIHPIAQRTKGGEIECGNVPTDGPSGNFAWRLEESERRVFLQYGCQTDFGRETLRMIDEVEKVVIDWAKPQPVAAVHKVRAPT